MYATRCFTGITIIALRLVCGVQCKLVFGDSAIHFSAAIRTGTYENPSAREFATVTRMSLIKCIRRCESTRSCMFANYNGRMKTCHLLECVDCSSVQSLQVKGLCYWNKSESNLTEEPLCNSCMTYDECNPTKIPPCLSHGCGVPMPVPYTVRKGNMYLTNSLIKYECLDNLTLTGNVTHITCQTDGSWTPVEFSCCSTCVPPTNITNATIVGMDGTYVEGDIIYYVCDQSFVMSTDNVSFSVCLANGSWSGVNFQCIATCVPPSNITNSTIVGMDGTYVKGDMIHYVCNQGFVMSTGTVSFSVCLADSSWSDVNFQCIATCVPPSNITNSTIVGMDGTYVKGDMIYFECNQGFVMSTGTVSFSLCLANGSWSAVNFQCVAECVPPESYTLTADSTFKYLVVFTVMNKDEALTNCEDACGKLLQINSIAKFQTMQTELNSNAVYDVTSYWIDGYWNSTLKEWRTTHDELIPRTIAIFKNAPAMNGNPPCVRMHRESNFQLFDTECSLLMRSICEQPP